MRGLVLSLFPGADLLGRAFEAEGYCVVRGPDALWGGDVRSFRGIAGKFEGVIGGPPCQVHSRAARVGTDAVDLIPEFLRVVAECAPRWAVMENVPEAEPEMPVPAWSHVILRDWDCGGLTSRRRAFWFYDLPAPAVPPKREGAPAWSVLASNWKGRTGVSGLGGSKGMHQILTPAEAARLQGFDGLDGQISAAQPGGVSDAGRRCLAIHMLGNGVPRALGAFVARHVVAVSQ